MRLARIPGVRFTMVRFRKRSDRALTLADIRTVRRPPRREGKSDSEPYEAPRTAKAHPTVLPHPARRPPTIVVT